MYKELFLGLVARNLTRIADKNVTEIGPYAFSGYGGYSPFISLTSAEFPNATTIGRNAFNGCMYLEELNIPNVSGSIPAYAFAGLEYVELIELPLATSLGQRVFFNNFRLKKINLPSVTTIENDSYIFQAVGDRRSDSDTDEYGNTFKTLIILSSMSMSDLTGKSYFPFGAPTTTKFQCSDGYIIYDSVNSQWKSVST